MMRLCLASTGTRQVIAGVGTDPGCSCASFTPSVPFSSVCKRQKCKIRATEKRPVVATGWDEGKGDDRRAAQEDLEVTGLLSPDGGGLEAAAVRLATGTELMPKRVHFSVCEVFKIRGSNTQTSVCLGEHLTNLGEGDRGRFYV